MAIGIDPQVRFAMHRLANVIDLLSLINSSVNFILYATMSNLFRNEFYQTFSCFSVFIKKWRRRQRRRLPPILKNGYNVGEGSTNLLNYNKTKDITET